MRPSKLPLALFTALLVISSGTTPVVISQSEAPYVLEVDFGIIGSEGDCDTSSDEYVISQSTTLPTCLLIRYEAPHNARVNLTIWSGQDQETEIQSIALIVTPSSVNTHRVVPTYLILHDEMSYGVFDYVIRITGWQPFSESQAPAPTVDADEHLLVVDSPESEISATFQTLNEGNTTPIVSQNSSLRGVIDVSNSGDSSLLVVPQLTQDGHILASASPFSIATARTESRHLSFPLPPEMSLGAQNLSLALNDARSGEAHWEDEIEISIVEEFGRIDIQHANWDFTSFKSTDILGLGSHPNDQVRVHINLTNTGGAPSSATAWIQFSSGSQELDSATLGDFTLDGGESYSSTHLITIPDSQDGDILEANMFWSSQNTSHPFGPIEMEQIRISDWPVDVTASMDGTQGPFDLDSTREIPLVFNVTNSEERGAAGLRAIATVKTLGVVLGSSSITFSIGANESKSLAATVPSSYCYSGSADVSLEIFDSSGKLIESTLSTDSVETTFTPGDFDWVSSRMMSEEAVSLGSPISIISSVKPNSETNPSGCEILVPLLTILDPTGEGIPPTTNISMVSMNGGQTTQTETTVIVVASNGSYEISQHLIRHFSKDASNPNWLESSPRAFASVEVNPSTPKMEISNCESSDETAHSSLGIRISCMVTSEMHVRTWFRIGSEIGGEASWLPPREIEPHDRMIADEIYRSYEPGSNQSASILLQVLWDGHWRDSSSGETIDLVSQHPLDGGEPLSGFATTRPAYPRWGEPFELQFRATGSSDWLDGFYEVTLWSDEDRSGLSWKTSEPVLHDLTIGQQRVFEVGFESWMPDGCSNMPYLVTAMDADMNEIDRLEGAFNGCNIEMPDLSIEGIELACTERSCIADLTINNTGDRDYSIEDGAEGARLSLIMDGLVEESGTTVPELSSGMSTTISVGIPKSGFEQIHFIVDAEMRFSDWDRANNGIGWASSTGPISFVNDSDFDGLPDSIEMSGEGYLVNYLSSRNSIEEFVSFLDQSQSSDALQINQRTSYPSPYHHDTDEDGLSDYMEWLIGTDANSPDTDDDGYGDLEELESRDQDPLMVELASPEIEAFEPTEAEHAEDSETKSGLLSRTHTRQFTVTDRNLAMVTVKVIRADGSSHTYEPSLVSQQGDTRQYSVTYEAPRFSEFQVNVTATDSLGNEMEFQIASQDSIFDRVTNKINKYATTSMLYHLGVNSVVLGFLTGLVYGLKDLADFATGAFKFLMDLKDSLSKVLEVIRDCLPGGGDCPIDLSKIAKEMWKSFVGLSPYSEGTNSHAAFLSFAVLGFLAFAYLSGSLAAKALGKARSMSSTIDDVASKLGRTKDAVISSLTDAVGSGVSKVKAGVPAAIITFTSKSLGAASKASSWAASTGIGSTIGIALSSSLAISTMIVKLPTSLLDAIGDHIKIRVLSKKTLNSKHTNKLILNKKKIEELLGNGKSSTDPDFLAIVSGNQKRQCSLLNKPCKGNIYERTSNYKGDANHERFHNVNYKHLDGVNQEIDGIGVHTPPDGIPVITFVDSKVCEGWMRCLLDDFLGLKSKKSKELGDLGQPGANKKTMSDVCEPLSEDLCSRALTKVDDPDICNGISAVDCDLVKSRQPNLELGSTSHTTATGGGLPADQAAVMASCIKKPQTCRWVQKYDVKDGGYKSLTKEEQSSASDWARKQLCELKDFEEPCVPDVLSDDWFDAFTNSGSLSGELYDLTMEATNTYSSMGGTTLVTPNNWINAPDDKSSRLLLGFALIVLAVISFRRAAKLDKS